MRNLILLYLILLFRAVKIMAKTENKFGGYIAFGLGFMLGTEHVSMGPNPQSFGHGGAGGSLGFADPDNHISLGFVMNQMHPGITAWRTATDVASSVYSSLNITT